MSNLTAVAHVTIGQIRQDPQGGQIKILHYNVKVARWVIAYPWGLVTSYSERTIIEAYPMVNIAATELACA